MHNSGQPPKASDLQGADELIQLMLDLSPFAMHFWDEDINLIDCNQEAVELLSMSSKEEYIARIQELMPEFQTDGQRSDDMLKYYVGEAFRTGYQKSEWVRCTLEGELVPVEVTLIRVDHLDGQFVATYSRDLREYKQMIQELEEAQFTTSAMFGANPQINILFNSDFEVIDCNPAAISFMGFKSKEEMFTGFIDRMNESLPEFQPGGMKSIPVVDRLVVAAEKGHYAFETEHIIDGETIYLGVDLKRIPYKSSFAIVAYLFDMTEATNTLLETERLREEAEAANKAKSAFLSTMSHEIRTPMNAILGITEIQLQNEALSKEMQEAFEKIYTSGDLLLGIINNILDLSKIEAGKLELVVDTYEIASLVNDTAQLNMMRIGSKPIDFELDVDENTPTHNTGDVLRVKQILNNLLSNAFKYTKEGTVRLSVWPEEAAEPNGRARLAFSVSDTGQGMTKEQVDKLFDEYARFNMESNRSTEGTGLGMSIVRNLISIMDGEISVASKPGQGSTFTVYLPQDDSEVVPLGKEVVENLQRFRTSSRAHMKRVQISREPMPYGSVLIVDDVETNIYVARGLLAPYGLQIDAVDSGFAAVERIKRGKAYDIVFMDHMMPEMDGVETTRIIRNMGYDRSIVALTANAVAGQAEVFLANGFDDYISKPIDIRQLNNTLNRLIRDKKPPEVVEQARKQAELDRQNPPDSAAKTDLDQNIVESFVRDAVKALATLRELYDENAFDDEENLRSYIINAHGIKSALANIGKADLSAVALKLEMAGREDKMDIISSDTPGFLDSLEAVIDELSPAADGSDDGEVEEDQAFLSEQLLVIMSACETYNKNAAKHALEDLRERTWSKPTNNLLGTISQYLLHSDFDEIADLVSDFLGAE